MTLQGPNAKKLAIHKMSLLMVPPGGGFASAIAALTRPGNLVEVAKEATTWTEAAIAAVRSAPDNPFASDEEIAGEILRQIDARRAARPLNP